MGLSQILESAFCYLQQSLFYYYFNLYIRSDRLLKGGENVKFIHTGDIHWGMSPDSDKPWSRERSRDIRDTFTAITAKAKELRVDCLFIAGDLFHRQPLMRELKEVNYLFSTIPDTRVYLMAGNHDFISRDSFYNTFEWNSNVTFFKNRELTYVKDSKLDVYVYGLSYYDREIKEGLYDKASPIQEEGIHILLAHGGDEKHIPLSAASLAAAGFDYIALGHIHKPQILIRDQAAFSGALEPIDRNDTGDHGYMEGRLINGRIRTEFVPFACRSYQQLILTLHEETTQISLEEAVKSQIFRRGGRNIYRIILQGMRSPDLLLIPEKLKNLGNITDVIDESWPAYDLSELYKRYSGTLIGDYIGYFLSKGELDTVEKKALYYGLQALLETGSRR